MARLCAIDIYSEVPVLDTINGKVIFAVQKQAGSISFDMDNLSIDDSGDTIRAILPREIIDLHEATEKNSWEVIDTKAIGPLALVRSDKFTLREENLVKSRVRAKSIRLLYTNGTVRKAREEGARELRRLLEHEKRRNCASSCLSCISFVMISDQFSFMVSILLNKKIIPFKMCLELFLVIWYN